MEKLKKQSEIIKDWEGDISHPIVSIQCLSYNQEKYIETTIKGFLTQETDFPFEVIIHDDASSDNTAKIIENYAKKYPQIIKSIFQKENMFSQGTKQDVHDAIYSIMKGEYIAICEGDDYWIDPKKIQKQYDIIQNNRNIVLSVHPAIRKMPNTTNYDIMGFHSNQSKLCNASEIILHGCGYSHIGSILIKRDIFLEGAIFNHGNTPPFYDCFIVYYASLKGIVHYMPDIMSVYRIHEKGWTGTKKDYKILIKEHIKAIAKLDMLTSKRYQKEFKYNISKMMYSAARYYQGFQDELEYKKLLNRSLCMNPVYYGTLSHCYKIGKLPKIGHTILKKFYSLYCKLTIR